MSDKREDGSWILIILCFVTVSICYADRTNISTAIVEMKREFLWSDSKIGFILSSFYYGYTFAQIPAGVLTKLMGGKIVLISGLCTFLLSDTFLQFKLKFYCSFFFFFGLDKLF